MGEARGLTYGGGGRLTGQQLPSGKTSSYSYDADGRLIGATGAAGQTRELERIAARRRAHAVDVTTGEGRVTRYTVEQTDGGGVRRRCGRRAASVSELLIAPDGTRTLTLPSGETRRTATVSDPRFGAALSVAREQHHDRAVGQERDAGVGLRRNAGVGREPVQPDVADAPT